jgi:hypothetical protein
MGLCCDCKKEPTMTLEGWRCYDCLEAHRRALKRATRQRYKAKLKSLEADYIEKQLAKRDASIEAQELKESIRLNLPNDYVDETPEAPF